MNLTDFLPKWRHDKNVMIFNGKMSLDNFLQLVLPHIDCSITWCNISETCKTSYQVCDRLLIRKYDEIGRETGAELKCGLKHGHYRIWHSSKACHRLYTENWYISGIPKNGQHI